MGSGAPLDDGTLAGVTCSVGELDVVRLMSPAVGEGDDVVKGE